MIQQPAAQPIVDTHAHLDDAAFDEDRDAVVAAFRAAGVVRVLNIGYRPGSWESSRRLREQYPEVELALGLHPQLAGDFTPRLGRDLRAAVSRLRPLAIGETGFDFSRARPSREEQRVAFRDQITIAAQERLPLIIHQRDAAAALIEEFDCWPEVAPIVLHSFDGNERLTRWAIERGCFVGIGGLATRRASAPLRDLLRNVALDRLLLETDAPYLAPPGAARRNTPANLPAIAEALAPVWETTPEELCWATSTNAAALFGLDFSWAAGHRHTE